jgi:hypothetical protein
VTGHYGAPVLAIVGSRFVSLGCTLQQRCETGVGVRRVHQNVPLLQRQLRSHEDGLPRLRHTPDHPWIRQRFKANETDPVHRGFRYR